MYLYRNMFVLYIRRLDVQRLLHLLRFNMRIGQYLPLKYHLGVEQTSTYELI
jgi:hypothetical protein